MEDKHVVSYELALELKQLRIPQFVSEGCYAYVYGKDLHLVHNDNDTGWLLGNDYETRFDWEEGTLESDDQWCRTFTIAELFDYMPEGVNWGVKLVKLITGYGVELVNYKVMPYERVTFVSANTAADAMAKMLWYMIDQRIINVVDLPNYARVVK